MADYDKDIPTDAMLFNPNSNAQAAPAKPTPFDFQKRQLAIDQRKAKIAQLMKDQKLTPDMPQGEMVSGHYVNPHWSQYLAAAAQPLLGQLATNREQEALGKEQEEFSQADRKAAIEHAMNAPGVATSGEDREGNPIVPPATPQGKIQWAEQGMNIPSRRDMLKKLIEDQTLQEPIRQEGRAEKRFDREDRQAEALRKQAEDLKFRHETQAATLAQSEKESARADDTRRFTAEQAHLDRRALIAANLAKAEGKPPKPLPAAQSKAWIENNTSLGKIEDALTELKTPEGQNAFGLTGATPDVILQRTDPKGVKARARVADIGSLKIHDRSGAAVTASETPRLKPFIPSVHDKPEVIKTKLENFQREYEMIQQEIANYAEDMNYIVPKVRPRTAAPAAPGAAPAPVRVNSVADAMKLPPGTPFIDPNGVQRTR